MAWIGALLVSATTSAQAPPAADPGLRADAPVDAHRPYAQELASSAAPDLVIAVAGSLRINSPAAGLPAWDPKVIEILNGRGFPSSTTVAVADLETTLIDASAFTGYPYPWGSAPVYAAPTSVAADLRNDGLSMVACANGHALDWGIEGMRATGSALDAAELKHAGTGEREGLARMASFLDEPGGKGRVALLSTATSFRPASDALSAWGAAPARPGISALELTALRLVPERQRTELQRLACRFQYPQDPGHCDRAPPLTAKVSLFGSQFGDGKDPSENYTTEYELNGAQAANELRFIREAKQNSDLALLAIAGDQQEHPGSPAPPAVLVRLAHAAIDAGADLTMATGGPVIGPIEIYQSANHAPRPILYGLGNLYWSPDAVSGLETPESHESVIVRSSITANTVRLEIYPVDLRATIGPAGTPRLADPVRARAILERLERLSAPFGTVIGIETYGATVRGRIVVTAGPVAAADGIP